MESTAKMSQRQKTNNILYFIKPRQNFKSAIGNIAIAMKSCFNNSEASHVSFKLKRQGKKRVSSRNSKSSSPSSNAVQVLHNDDVKSENTTSQHPHISCNGHGDCPTRRENSSSNEIEALESLSYSSFQIDSLLHEQRQGSLVDNANNNSQGQNHGTTPSGVESNAEASPTTLTTISAFDKCIKTNSVRNNQKIRRGSSSSGTAKPGENRIGSHSNSNDNFTSESPSSPFPSNQSASEPFPQSDNIPYENLGIITAHPEKPEFALERDRRKSFEGWPPEHHLKPDDLAKAGFFYSGYSDAARCFYCSGGLRLWEDGDDVWVEHARWFPQCEFLRQTVGCAFIDAVQELKKEQNVITYEDVLTNLETRGLKDSIPKDKNNPTSDLDQNTAVKAMLDAGFPRNEVLEAAGRLQQDGQTVAGDLLYDEVYKQEAMKPKDSAENVNGSSKVDTKNVKENEESYENLKKEVAELRLIGVCKICMDKKVSVVFLPCGHLISCQDCSYALKSCPICRDSIKGVVRAYMS